MPAQTYNINKKGLLTSFTRHYVITGCEFKTRAATSSETPLVSVAGYKTGQDYTVSPY